MDYDIVDNETGSKFKLSWEGKSPPTQEDVAYALSLVKTSKDAKEKPKVKPSRTDWGPGAYRNVSEREEVLTQGNPSWKEKVVGAAGALADMGLMAGMEAGAVVPTTKPVMAALGGTGYAAGKALQRGVKAVTGYKEGVPSRFATAKPPIVQTLQDLGEGTKMALVGEAIPLVAGAAARAPAAASRKLKSASQSLIGSTLKSTAKLWDEDTEALWRHAADEAVKKNIGAAGKDNVRKALQAVTETNDKIGGIVNGLDPQARIGWEDILRGRFSREAGQQGLDGLHGLEWALNEADLSGSPMAAKKAIEKLVKEQMEAHPEGLTWQQAQKLKKTLYTEVRYEEEASKLNPISAAKQNTKKAIAHQLKTALEQEAQRAGLGDLAALNQEEAARDLLERSIRSRTKLPGKGGVVGAVEDVRASNPLGSLAKWALIHPNAASGAGRSLGRAGAKVEAVARLPQQVGSALTSRSGSPLADLLFGTPAPARGFVLGEEGILSYPAKPQRASPPRGLLSMPQKALPGVPREFVLGEEGPLISPAKPAGRALVTTRPAEQSARVFEKAFDEAKSVGAKVGILRRLKEAQQKLGEEAEIAYGHRGVMDPVGGQLQITDIGSKQGPFVHEPGVVVPSKKGQQTLWKATRNRPTAASDEELDFVDTSIFKDIDNRNIGIPFRNEEGDVVGKGQSNLPEILRGPLEYAGYINRTKEGKIASYDLDGARSAMKAINGKKPLTPKQRDLLDAMVEFGKSERRLER